jgi:hypothetical protein
MAFGASEMAFRTAMQTRSAAWAAFKKETDEFSDLARHADKGVCEARFQNRA